MSYLKLIPFLSLFLIAASPRYPSPKTPDQIWQNDLDLNDKVDSFFPARFDISLGSHALTNVSTITVSFISASTISVSFISSTITVTGGVNFLNGISVSTSAQTGAAFSITPTSASIDVPASIRGSQSNAAIAKGDIGEYITALIPSVALVTANATGQWVSLTTITVSAGVWTVFGMPTATNNGSTVTLYEGAVSLFPNNTTTDHVTGYNVSLGLPTSATSTDNTFPIVGWDVRVLVDTPIYLKAFANYTVAPPKFYGAIVAIRRG